MVLLVKDTQTLNKSLNTITGDDRSFLFQSYALIITMIFLKSLIYLLNLLLNRRKKLATASFFIPLVKLAGLSSFFTALYGRHIQVNLLRQRMTAPQSKKLLRLLKSWVSAECEITAPLSLSGHTRENHVSTGVGPSPSKPTDGIRHH